MKTIAPVLSVKAVEKSVAWFQRVLDFQITYLNQQPDEDESSNYAVISNGDVTIHLGLESELNIIVGNGGCHLSTDNFDSVHDRAIRQGAIVYLPLHTNPVGKRSFGIKDPDGNLIAIAQV